MLSIAPTPKPLELNFGSSQDGQDWRVLNDGVMGGLSQSKITLTENSLQFSGEVSLANNGGFASLRCPFQTLDLSGYETVEIKMRSKGQSFALVLETSSRWYDPYFKSPLKRTAEGEWEVLRIPLSSLQATRVGRSMNRRLAAEDQAAIIRMGFITNDKKEGPFYLEIDYLKFE